jgi:hypothetical protein
MEYNINNGKKRLTPKEYNQLPEEEKKKYKEMIFDEEFNPGMGDDICLSYRVWLSGKELYVVNFWVDHHRQGEHFQDQEELNKKHAEYFRRKFKLGEYNETNSNTY